MIGTCTFVAARVDITISIAERVRALPRSALICDIVDTRSRQIVFTLSGMSRGRRSIRFRPAGTRVQHVPALYFLHIPKTAGTSFMTALRRQYGERDVCPALLWHQLLAIPEAQRSSYQLYVGHFSSYLHRVVERPLRTVTLLRDPVERSLSHYAHVLRDPNHYYHDRAVRQGSFAAFLEDPLTGPLISNFQVRSLAYEVDVVGHAATLSPAELASLKLEQHVDTALPPPDAESRLLSDALDTLDRCAFVGLTERYEESLDRLGRLLGWRKREASQEVLNSGDNRLQANDLDGRTLSALRDRVHLDLAMYEVARSRFHAAGVNAAS